MIAVFSFLAVITVSLIVVRVATVALTLTGLSKQLARFQARSAFTGAGFTTNESEKVVGHPVRRRVIMLLMLLGNAGIVTAVSSLMLSFLDEGTDANLATRGLMLLVGLAIVWWLATSAWVDRVMTQVIGWALRRFTTVDARDYAGLLHLTGDYVVAELTVDSDDWLCDETLKDLRLNTEGVLVLGLEHPSGEYTGAPRGDTLLQSGDTLLLYGRRAVIEKLDNRTTGSQGAWEHVKQVEEQKAIELSEHEQRESKPD